MPCISQYQIRQEAKAAVDLDITTIAEETGAGVSVAVAEVTIAERVDVKFDNLVAHYKSIGYTISVP